MNSVYVPVQVVVFLRRLVNIISTLSISNQYLLLKRNHDEDGEKADTDAQPLLASWDVLRAVEWPWWTGSYSDTWASSHLQRAENIARLLPQPPTLEPHESPTLRSSVTTLPWFGRSWSWPSLLSASTDRSVEPARPSPPPPTKQSSPQTNPNPIPRKPPSVTKDDTESLDTIHRLLHSPVLYDPVRAPRYPIVLCHGLYGFDVRGPSSFPSLRLHYWSNVLHILRKKVGADVIVTSVPGTGSIAARAEKMDAHLQTAARGRGVNLLAHSMGGLDCRHLITHVRPDAYVPLSLTTVCTPHRGSPFMDWCAENIGIGKLRQQELSATGSKAPSPSDLASSSAFSSLPPSPPPKSTPFPLSLSSLPSSFTTLLLSAFDSPAYANLTSSYLTSVFNPSTPDSPSVRYFSVASRARSVPVWHPLWLPKTVLDGAEQKERAARDGVGGDGESDMWGNDGLVSVHSARWGEFLGVLEGCDHWEMRGARGLELEFGEPGSGSTSEGTGDGSWGIRDWGRFVGAWRRAEQGATGGGGSMDERTMKKPESAREKEARDEAVLKSSTDKLSVVFDWIVEQVPASASSRLKSPVEATVAEQMKKETESKEERKNVNELASKGDLERFYVALSRKLYDEGL